LKYEPQKPDNICKFRNLFATIEQIQVFAEKYIQFSENGLALAIQKLIQELKRVANPGDTFRMKY